MFSDIRCLCMVIRHTLEAHTCTSLMGNMECCGPRRAFYNDHPMSPHTMMDDDKQKPTQRFFPEASPRTLATASSSHIENPLYASLHSASAAAAEEEQQGRG